MVSTRHHPREFPEPATPTHRSSPSSTVNNTPSTPPPTTSRDLLKSATKSPSKRESSAFSPVPTLRPAPAPKSRAFTAGYTHNPTALTLIWLLGSLVLVVWDTLYVFGRPHTMPGGSWHSPFWTPYRLYGEVDFGYGFPAWNNHDGFTAAQGSLNVVESLAYMYYLYVVFTQGELEGRRNFWKTGKAFEVKGQGVGLALVVCFAATTMTVSKTVLYWLNEFFSGFEYIGHNSWSRLFWVWVIPNGAWIVLPSYMMYVFGKEIVDVLDRSSEKAKQR